MSNLIDYEKVFLILDAFDEIGSEDKSQFAKKLNKFASQNPNTIILISSRNNFYSFAEEGESNGLFKGFAEYATGNTTALAIGLIASCAEL